MERTGALINRLQEQYLQNAGADKMLITLQILAAELEMENSKQVQKDKGVSVVAPVFLKSRIEVDEEVFTPAPEVKVAEVKPVVQESKTTIEEPVVVKAQPPVFAAVHNTPPVTTQRHEVVEVNEMIGRREESLNERLKAASVNDLGAMLQSSPVKDLKKAIGINDRYVFLNELFRGDEQMYERSIKTINAFSIHAEAEYWIKRELKLKLGWNEDAAPVKQFDQLVRRRFS